MFTIPTTLLSSVAGGAPSGDFTIWQEKGNPYTALTYSSADRIAYMGGTRFVIQHNEDGLQMMNWDGTDWTTVGNETDVLPAGNTQMRGLVILDNTVDAERVAYVSLNDDKIYVYDFDGTDWTQVGTAFSVTATASHMIAGINSTDIVHVDSINDLLTTLRFNGSTWSQVGNTLDITAWSPTDGMVMLDASTLVINDNQIFEAYDWDGTDWTVKGNVSGSIATLGETSLAKIDSGSFYGYPTGNIAQGEIYRTVKIDFDGTDFTRDTVSFDFGISFGGAQDKALAVHNSTEVAVLNTRNGFDRIQMFELVTISDTRAIPTHANMCAWWDMTMEASYDGNVANGLKNLVTSPNDGSTQASYDLHFGATAALDTDDPTPNGSVNSPLMYAQSSGSEFFTLKATIANAITLNDLQKNTSQFTFILVMDPDGAGNGESAFGTGDSSTDEGLSHEFRSSDTRIAQHSGASSNSIDDGTAPSSDLHIKIISVDMNSTVNNYRTWDTGKVTVLTKQEQSNTFNVNSDSASGTFRLLATDNGLGTGVNDEMNSSKFIAAGVLDAFIDTAAAQTLIDEISALHLRNYLG